MSTAFGFSVPPPPDPHYNDSEGQSVSDNTSKWTPRVNMSTVFPPTRGHGGLSVEPNPNLYIHNVPKDATEQELKDLFSSFGTVERIRLKVNQKIGPQALYAFVTFSSTSEAQLALRQLNGYDMRSRRLRVEFQRLRGDEDRNYNNSSYMGEYSSPSRKREAFKRRSSSMSLRPREFGPCEDDTRKRAHFSYGPESNGYGGQYGFNKYDRFPDDGFSHKRARQYDMRKIQPELHSNSSYNFSEPSNTSCALRYSDSRAPGVNPSSSPWVVPGPNTAHRHRQFGAQPKAAVHNPPERITIYLCELLRHLGLSALFSSNETDSTQALENQGPVAEYSAADQGATQSFCANETGLGPKDSCPVASRTAVNSSPRSSAATLYSDAAPLPISTKPAPVWIGHLARNGRRKVPIMAFPISGSVEEFLSSETQLNISHRSSWNELSKKPLCSICYFELSDRELESDGSGTYSFLTPQKKESYMKCFKDHVDYFTTKKKAGVIALAEGKHLYIVPRGTFFFDQYGPSSIPPDVPVLLGLFTQGMVPQSFLPNNREGTVPCTTESTEEAQASNLMVNYNGTTGYSTTTPNSNFQPQQTATEIQTYRQSMSITYASTDHSRDMTAYPSSSDHESGAAGTSMPVRSMEDRSFLVPDPQPRYLQNRPQHASMTPGLNASTASQSSTTSSCSNITNNTTITGSGVTTGGAATSASSNGASTTTGIRTALTAQTSGGERPTSSNTPTSDVLMSLLSSPRLLEALRATAQLQQPV